MKTYSLTLIIIFTNLLGFAQNNYSSIELEVSIPIGNELSYHENDSKHTLYDPNMGAGLSYTYNYMSLENVSIGGLLGFKYLGTPTGSSIIRTGIIGRYHFQKLNNLNVYLMSSLNIPLDKDLKFSLGNVRAGVHYPFIKDKNFNWLIGLYFERDKIGLKNSLLNNSSNNSSRIIYRNIGIGLGIQF